MLHDPHRASTRATVGRGYVRATLNYEPECPFRSGMITATAMPPYGCSVSAATRTTAHPDWIRQIMINLPAEANRALA